MGPAEPPIASGSAPRQPFEGSTVALVITGAIGRADIPKLCKHVRTLLAGGDAEAVLCDVGALADPDAVSVDALAHLQLTAKRCGRQMWLQGASPQLQELLVLLGLDRVVQLYIAAAGTTDEFSRRGES